MVVAHAASGEGIHVEALLIAAAFLVLGIVFYVQKSAKPMVSVGLVLVALLVGTGAFVFADDGTLVSDASVRILTPQDGEVVPSGEAVRVEAGVQGDDGSGHIHIYVDGQIVSMPQGSGADVRLEPGSHTIAVEYVGADHVSFAEPVRDEVTVTAE